MIKLITNYSDNWFIIGYLFKNTSTFYDNKKHFLKLQGKEDTVKSN